MINIPFFRIRIIVRRSAIASRIGWNRIFCITQVAIAITIHLAIRVCPLPEFRRLITITDYIIINGVCCHIFTITEKIRLVIQTGPGESPPHPARILHSGWNARIHHYSIFMKSLDYRFPLYIARRPVFI